MASCVTSLFCPGGGTCWSGTLPTRRSAPSRHGLLPTSRRTSAIMPLRSMNRHDQREARKNGHADGRRSWQAHAAPDCHSRSEEHTSELQSLMRISYAVFCLKKQTSILIIFSMIKNIILTQPTIDDPLIHDI